MTNKYPGKCHACGLRVEHGEGVLERSGSKWLVWCMACYDQSDNSSYEDRVCGNRAYEDRCSRAGDWEDACLARAEYEGNLL